MGTREFALPQGYGQSAVQSTKQMFVTSPGLQQLQRVAPRGGIMVLPVRTAFGTTVVTDALIGAAQAVEGRVRTTAESPSAAPTHQRR